MSGFRVYPTDASAKEQRDLKPPHRKLWGEPTDRKQRPAAQFLAGLPSDYGDEVLARLKRRRTAAIVVYPIAPDPSALASSPERKEIVLALAWITPIDLA